MKNIFKILPILFVTAAVVGCDGDTPEEKKVEKTSLAFTYSDVMSHYFRTASTIPNSGNPELLVLPIYFSDSSNYISEEGKKVVKDDIEIAFNGTKEQTGFESVSSYYSALSMNKCNIKFNVADWICVENESSEFNFSEDQTLVFVNSIVDQYFTSHPGDRNKYDLDKNGYLDGVIVVYGSPDSESLRDTTKTNLWAYTNFATNKPNVESPTLCNFMWASYDFMYNRSVARAKLGNYYGAGDCSNCNIDTHIFIHETGHMFGLIDYYDYSYHYSPAGAFSMQDHNIGCHDPYSVMALGWSTPYIPTESCTINLKTFQSSRECIILTNQWNSLNSPFDEYLVVEFYSPDGLNQFDHDHSYQGTRATGAAESGIRLWHVDARLLYNTYTDPTQITLDPTIENNKVIHMMSNTYYSNDGRGRNYVTPLGRDYADYNLLQLIRNEEVETYKPTNNFDRFSLFKEGSKFTMQTFKKQFKNSGKLNSGKTLGWTFEIESVQDEAVIKLTRTI